MTNIKRLNLSKRMDNETNLPTWTFVGAWNKSLDEVDRLRGLLSELAAVVRGECPRLLDEDSGGNAQLDMDITQALTTGEGE
jgi:hypothetical protein